MPVEGEVKEAYKAALEKSRIVVAGNEYSKMDVAEPDFPFTLENVLDSLIRMVDDADADAFLHMCDEVRAGRDASCIFRYRTVAGSLRVMGRYRMRW